MRAYCSGVISMSESYQIVLTRPSRNEASHAVLAGRATSRCLNESAAEQVASRSNHPLTARGDLAGSRFSQPTLSNRPRTFVEVTLTGVRLVQPGSPLREVAHDSRNFPAPFPCSSTPGWTAEVYALPLGARTSISYFRQIKRPFQRIFRS